MKVQQHIMFIKDHETMIHPPCLQQIILQLSLTLSLFIIYFVVQQNSQKNFSRIKIIYMICRFMNINFICKNEHTHTHTTQKKEYRNICIMIYLLMVYVVLILVGLTPLE